jgi:hypothetical protein
MWQETGCAYLTAVGQQIALLQPGTLHTVAHGDRHNLHIAPQGVSFPGAVPSRPACSWPRRALRRSASLHAPLAPTQPDPPPPPLGRLGQEHGEKTCLCSLPCREAEQTLCFMLSIGIRVIGDRRVPRNHGLRTHQRIHNQARASLFATSAFACSEIICGSQSIGDVSATPVLITPNLQPHNPKPSTPVLITPNLQPEPPTQFPKPSSHETVEEQHPPLNPDPFSLFPKF